MSDPSSADPPFLGLRTVIHPAPDLAAAKAWTTRVLGFEPYFDADFSVGWSLGGYELALDPNADPARGIVAFWGVADADAAFRHLVDRGAVPGGPVQEVGEGIRTVTFTSSALPGVIGIIENPHFAAAPPPEHPAGPGR